MILCELAGCFFHQHGVSKHLSQIDYIMSIFRQLGTPAATSWPLWPKAPPQFKRQPWPDSVASCLGIDGLALLDAWLMWMPDSRLLVAASAGHAYFHPERFDLGGEPWDALSPVSQEGCGPEFRGNRHNWNVRVGTCSPEVLSWLRADPVLQVGTVEHAALGLDFSADRSNAKSEERRKFILSGAVGSCSSGYMCGLSLGKPLPFRRLLAWHHAFVHVNATLVAELGAAARLAIGRISYEDRATNGQHVIDTPVRDWFLTCGELNISNANPTASSSTASSPAASEPLGRALSPGRWGVHPPHGLDGVRTERCEVRPRPRLARHCGTKCAWLGVLRSGHWRPAPSAPPGGFEPGGASPVGRVWAVQCDGHAADRPFPVQPCQVAECNAFASCCLSGARTELSGELCSRKLAVPVSCGV